jgi:hypothetical protein
MVVLEASVRNPEIPLARTRFDQTRFYLNQQYRMSGFV